MAFITVYSLFGDDIRNSSFSKSWDNVFDSLTIFCLVSFMIEICLFSLVNEGYFCGFYFWLDFVSTCSLIADINFLMKTITQTQDYTASNA